MHYYMHILRGKIQIRTSALQKNSIAFSSIDDYLKSVSGVVSVKTNSALGSVLIHYNRHLISAQSIVSQLAQQGLELGLLWKANALTRPEASVS